MNFPPFHDGQLCMLLCAPKIIRRLVNTTPPLNQCRWPPELAATGKYCFFFNYQYRMCYTIDIWTYRNCRPMGGLISLPAVYGCISRCVANARLRQTDFSLCASYHERRSNAFARFLMPRFWTQCGRDVLKFGVFPNTL